MLRQAAPEGIIHANPLRQNLCLTVDLGEQALYANHLANCPEPPTLAHFYDCAPPPSRFNGTTPVTEATRQRRWTIM